MSIGKATRIGMGVGLVVALIVGVVLVALRPNALRPKTMVTAYFDNSNGIYAGDEVRVLGVPVGKIVSIEPQPQRAKITFWVDAKYKVPAGAEAAILAPTLVTARFIQLNPAYTGGPALADNAVIPIERTVVPVEYDDLRSQLEKLSATLQPTRPGGVSTAGAFVTTVADNLRGQGAAIHDNVVKLSQTLSILGDHSSDIFGTAKSLATLVTALQTSSDLMGQLNKNLAGTSALLANDPNEVGNAVVDLNSAVEDVSGFLADNREALGTSSDRLADITKALGESLGDVKQALHVFPTTLSNFVNIYHPAQSAGASVASGSWFANPMQFICGAVQAASRLNAEQSAKLCVQYMAPIFKNRQYNFLGPLGFNGAPNTVPIPLGPLALGGGLLPFPVFPVGTIARPNEVTFSEDWMRPDYVPPAAAGAPAAPPLSAEAHGQPTASTDPNAGLAGMMAPAGGGS